MELFTDDELDRQMEEATARKTHYDDWLAELAAVCHRRGIAVPQSFARQRAWNEYQRETKRQLKMEQRRVEIREAVAKLQRELAQLNGEQYTAEQSTADPDDAFFASMEQELRRTAEAHELQSKTAERQQRELMLKSIDGDNEGEISH